MQDVNDKYMLMEEAEKNAVRTALIEERGRFCLFISCIKPFVVSWINPCEVQYGKCSKILNIFLFLFSYKMSVFRAGTHKMLVKIANSDGPDHTAYLGAQWLSGRVLDSRPKGHRFEPHQRHWVVSLSKNINPSLVLVQPGKTRP